MSGFITSLAISVLIMPLMVMLSKKHNILDRPNHRKRHGAPTPLMGGLGIFVAFSFAMLMHLEYNLDILRIIIYSGLILILGVIDDLKALRATHKLILELILAFFMILGGMRLYIGKHLGLTGHLTLLLDIPLSLIWVVGITNATNILDGLDGLAGGVSLVASGAFALIFAIEDYSFGAQLSLILMGAILGFIIYNFYPSRLFMGDGGSLFIGFILSILSIMYIQGKGTGAAIGIPIIILAVPIFEMGFSILRRIIKGRNIMAADDGHIHYSLLRRGYTPLMTVFIIFGVSILFGILGVIIVHKDLSYLVPIIILFLIGMGIRVNI